MPNFKELKIAFRHAVKYVLLLFVFWFAHGSLIPFLTTIFHGYGYDNTTIGRIMMTAGMCSMISAPASRRSIS